MDKFISQTDSSLKKKKRRWTPKGRQAENKFYDEVSSLFHGINFKLFSQLTYQNFRYKKSLLSQAFKIYLKSLIILE